MDMNHILGNEVYIDEDRPIFRNAKGQFISLKSLKCPKCGKKPAKDGCDPCLGKLPGVLAACCGHGGTGHNQDGTGYILFENGVEIRGHFEVKRWQRPNYKKEGV